MMENVQSIGKPDWHVYINTCPGTHDSWYDTMRPGVVLNIEKMEKTN